MADEHVICKCPRCDQDLVLHADRGVVEDLRSYTAASVPLGLIADLVSDIHECPACHAALEVESDFDFDKRHEVCLVVLPDIPCGGE